jgi:hypothetical protein
MKMSKLGNGKLGANIKGGIDVNLQSQTAPLFQYFLMNELKTDITLTSDVAKDDEVINVSPGHGFTAAPNEYITLFQGDGFLQSRVVSVSLDAITIELPSDASFVIANTKVIRGSNQLAVNGSITPIDFIMNLRDISIPIDISKIVMTMFHTSAGDDGKFGGITELSSGLWFRKEDGFDFNFGNYKNNQDFKNVGSMVEYSAKGPAGTESTTIYFDVENIFGQVIRINRNLSDILFGQVRDDLTSLDSFIISLIGSYTEGE